MASFFGISSEQVADLTPPFTIGAAVIAMLSIANKERRSALRILVGMILGGLGCTVAWMTIPENISIFGIQAKIYLCGVVGVMTEHTLLGFMKFSEEFAENPWEKAERIWSKVPWSKK